MLAATDAALAMHVRFTIIITGSAPLRKMPPRHGIYDATGGSLSRILAARARPASPWWRANILPIFDDAASSRLATGYNFRHLKLPRRANFCLAKLFASTMKMR